MDSGTTGKQGARLDMGVLVPASLCSGAENATAGESCFTVENIFSWLGLVSESLWHGALLIYFIHHQVAASSPKQEANAC